MVRVVEGCAAPKKQQRHSFFPFKQAGFYSALLCMPRPTTLR